MINVAFTPGSYTPGLSVHFSHAGGVTTTPLDIVLLNSRIAAGLDIELSSKRVSDFSLLNSRVIAQDFILSSERMAAGSSDLDIILLNSRIATGLDVELSSNRITDFLLFNSRVIAQDITLSNYRDSPLSLNLVLSNTRAVALNASLLNARAIVRNASLQSRRATTIAANAQLNSVRSTITVADVALVNQRLAYTLSTLDLRLVSMRRANHLSVVVDVHAPENTL